MTVRVPKSLIRAVFNEEVELGALYAFCALAAHPSKSESAIQMRYGLEDLWMQQAGEFELAPEPVKPVRQPAQSRGGSGDRQRRQQNQSTYEDVPPAPAQFVDWLRQIVEESIDGGFPVSDETADQIYHFKEDKQHIIDALVVVKDFHENNNKVRSPGGFLLSQVKKFPAEKAGQIAWAIHNKGSNQPQSARQTRSMERADEYIQNSPRKRQRKEYFEE